MAVLATRQLAQLEESHGVEHVRVRPDRLGSRHRVDVYADHRAGREFGADGEFYGGPKAAEEGHWDEKKGVSM